MGWQVGARRINFSSGGGGQRRAPVLAKRGVRAAKSRKQRKGSAIEPFTIVPACLRVEQRAVSKRNATDRVADGGWCSVLDRAGDGNKEPELGTYNGLDGQRAWWRSSNNVSQAIDRCGRRWRASCAGQSVIRSVAAGFAAGKGKGDWTNDSDKAGRKGTGDGLVRPFYLQITVGPLRPHRGTVRQEGRTLRLGCPLPVQGAFGAYRDAPRRTRGMEPSGQGPQRVSASVMKRA